MLAAAVPVFSTAAAASCLLLKAGKAGTTAAGSKVCWPLTLLCPDAVVATEHAEEEAALAQLPTLLCLLTVVLLFDFWGLVGTEPGMGGLRGLAATSGFFPKSRWFMATVEALLGAGPRGVGSWAPLRVPPEVDRVIAAGIRNKVGFNNLNNCFTYSHSKWQVVK